MSKADEIRAVNRELLLLAEVSDRYKIPTAAIAQRLVAWAEQPLPDTFPPLPQRVRFQWPRSGGVDFVGYWREVDRRIR
jgi:hypothetical protein